MSKNTRLFIYGALFGVCASLAAAQSNAPTNLRVAIYSGTGAASDKIMAVCRAVAATGHQPMAISLSDLTNRLTTNNFDVLLLPSGEDETPVGSGHYAGDLASLGSANAKTAIRNFVAGGGGFVGIEVGAAFACTNFGTVSSLSGSGLCLGLCSTTYWFPTPGSWFGGASTLTFKTNSFGTNSQVAYLSRGGGDFYPNDFTNSNGFVIADDAIQYPGVIGVRYFAGRVALSSFSLELRGDSEDDWTIWDNWDMSGTHSNSVGTWELLGRLIGWAYNGNSSKPTIKDLGNPAASRVAVVASHTTDGGAYPGLLPAVGRAISFSGHRPLAIRFGDIKSGQLTTNNFKVVTFPGGYAYGYQTGLSNYEQNIRSFVSNGGSYFGICAGSFYSATTVRWQGTNYPYPLGLFQGQAVGEIADIAPWPNYTNTPTKFTNDVVLGPLGAIQQMYYGGGYHVSTNTNQIVHTVATFSYTGTNQGTADAVRFNYGAGRVFLITTHPEVRLGSLEDWLYWDGFQNNSSATLTNPDNSWRVVSAAFNSWLAPQSSNSFGVTNWQRVSSTNFELSCSGPAGWLPTVLGSTNLVTWSDLGKAVEDSPGNYFFTHTNASAAQQQFYRFRQP